MKESVLKVLLYFMHHESIMFTLSSCCKHMLLFHEESESEPILVEQVVEESPVVSRFDICGTDPKPEIVNEGKPRFMH